VNSSKGVVSLFNNPTIEKLKEMKLKVMAEMFTETNPEMLSLSFEDRLGLMVERQWLAKKNAKTQNLLRVANFGINACLEDVDYSSERSIDKKTIVTLSTCNFIEQKLNIIISGKTGSGKSFLACAFGNNACRRGYSVKYYRVPELLIEIQDAKIEHRYLKFISQLQRIKLLVLDDIGLKSYALDEGRELLEIAESRYNKASTIMAGQIPHSEWYDLFPDTITADAFMDRMIHNSYILALDSKKSMREIMAVKTVNGISKMGCECK
jgi:DNA replication protein DnaC